MKRFIKMIRTSFVLACLAMDTQLVEHPMIQDRLLILRDHRTGPTDFRSVLGELSTMLVYEACRSMATTPSVVATPVGKGLGFRLASLPLIVPILRGGLGMADAAAKLLPGAGIGFVGLARDPVSEEPELYLTRLPERLSNRTALVLDPVLASGRSIERCCRLLVERGCQDIVVVCAIAATEGLDLLADTKLPIRVVTAAIDNNLNDEGYVVPGMGDAGDRQFDEVAMPSSG